MPEYTWKRGGFRFNSIDPQIAGQELAEMEAREGKIQPKNVVERARPKRSPLHGAFDWDDKRAAEKFRIEQARDLIRSIGVVVSKNNKPKIVHFFVHVPPAENEESGYVNVEHAVANPAQYARALNHLFTMVEKLEAAVEELQDAAGKAGIPKKGLAKVQRKTRELIDSTRELQPAQ